MNNTNRTIARYAWLLALVFFLGIFVPERLGIEGMDGGFAIATILIFFVITSVVTAIVFGRMAKEQERILAPDNLLAHWQYMPLEWQEYTEKEHMIDAEGKKKLFFVVVGFALFFAVLFPLLDPESGIVVTYTMFGLIVLIGLVAYFSIKIPYQQNKKNLGDAYIAKNGVLINNQLHCWSILGGRFEHAAFHQAQPSYLEFKYSTPNRYSRQMNSVRVPIPSGKEKEAQSIITTLSG